MSKHTIQEHMVNAVKDVPPVAVGSLTLFGVQLSDWVLILTAVYTIIRIASELRQWKQRKTDDRDSAVLVGRDTNDPN